MSDLNKVKWEVNDNRIRRDVEFSKVNKEKRLVSGWATIDNVDTADEIVTAEASVRAFSRARGNLREMHKKDESVGKIVSFEEQTYIDPKGQSYRGIYVTAYVSKGAPNTWEKVLDGTLSGFSIGGSVISDEEDFEKSSGRKIRKITDYDLTELSLVDNPGNQYADILHIQKSADGSVTRVTGLAAETNISNVFYCKDDEIIKRNEGKNADCPVCSKSMSNVGWVEDTADANVKATDLVAKFVNPTNDSIRKGGETVSTVDQEKDETVATGHEAGDPTEVPTPARTEGDEPVEEVTDDEGEAVEEVVDEDKDILKSIDALRETVQTQMKDTKEETVEAINKLHNDFDSLQKSFAEKTSEFEKRFEELDKSWETTKSRLSGFEKSLQVINGRDSISKSVDYEGPTDKKTESENPWSGSAFSVEEFIR